MNKHLIWVKANCDNYGRFMHKVQFLGICIFDVKYEQKKIYLKIAMHDFDKLKKYLISYKFVKHKEIGVYHLKEIFSNNHLFLFMIIMALSVYFVLTNLIVKINIVHENKEIRELLYEELKERGVKVLTFKKSYEKISKIKEEILDAYPDKIDWIEIEENGMVYDVKVEERIITDTNNEEKTCDLIAKKDGTISHIKIKEGEALIDLNDYVRKGDTLVTGQIKHNEEIKRNICASGEVYANVWYTINVTVPIYYKEYIKTGKKKYNFVWEVNENKKQLFKDRFSSYESHYKTLLKAFDFSLFLDTEYETEETILKLSEEEALNKALEKADESIKKRLGEKDHIIDKKVLKKQGNDSTIDVEIFVIVEELISEEKLTVINEEEELKNSDMEHD